MIYRWKICKALAVYLFAVAALLAQTPTGGIEGTVTDATGQFCRAQRLRSPRVSLTHQVPFGIRADF